MTVIVIVIVFVVVVQTVDSTLNKGNSNDNGTKEPLGQYGSHQQREVATVSVGEHQGSPGTAPLGGRTDTSAAAWC
jgi:hypothetical protein